MSRVMRYGRGTVEVELPEACCREVIEPEAMSGIGDLDEQIARCLDDPIETRPLREVLAGCGKIALVIPDATRSAGMRTWLPALLRYVRETAGVGPERWSMVIATGKHRLPTEKEIEHLVGPDVVLEWPVFAHSADMGNVDAGVLEDGTRVAVDRRVAEADCIVLAGAIVHHYLAGFGGGRKLIAPGVCGRETVDALHSRTLANIDFETGDWRSRAGELNGNPFHAAVVAAAKTVGPAFAVNWIVGRQGQVVDVLAGDPFKSHEAACARHDRLFRVPISERLPLVVASCGGWPYDVNLYQAHKGIDNAFRAVARGGTIVLLAECCEGWGPPSFVEWLGIESLEEHRARLGDRFEIAGHTTYALKWKATQCRVIVVSHVLSERIESGEGPAWIGRQSPSGIRLEFVRSAAAALDRAAGKKETPFYVIPTASACLPHAGSPAGRSKLSHTDSRT